MLFGNESETPRETSKALPLNTFEVPSGSPPAVAVSSEYPSFSSAIRSLDAGHDAMSESSSASITSAPTPLDEGSECEMKTLYEGPSKCKCCINWADEYPDDLRNSIEEEEEVKKKALVVRMKKNHSEGKPLVLDSVVVQSAHLKQLLGRVFDGYKGITATLNKLVFRAPFHPFYHRWSLLTELVNSHDGEDSPDARHARLFYSLISEQLSDTITDIKDLLANDVITFEYLWALFEPGGRIVSFVNEHERIFLFHHCEYKMDGGGNRFLELSVRFVDWDGERFGYRETELHIMQFKGTQRITELKAYPFKFHASPEQVEATALARGNKFQMLGGMHYMAYSGVVEWKDERGYSRRRNVDGRVVVDMASYIYMHPQSALKLIPLDSYSPTPEIDVTDNNHWGFRGPPGVPPPLAPFRHRRRRRSSSSSNSNGEPRRVLNKATGANMESEETGRDDLTKDQLILCNSHVRGYSLKIKKWVEFNVDLVRPISWNDAAFPNLMLPKSFKDLALSFVESHMQSKLSFDDVIEGKGQGIIMLLAGNPGIGKTLTAEAIADRVRKPLYVLSAGELGSEAYEIEKSLESILEITERWDAVLLFDECDVFLEKRSSNGMDHNEIVSVFLRTLEYYRGILFMTTNRSSEIDPAFHSRIHLTLHYPDLDPEAKRHIWMQFVTNSGYDHGLVEKDFDELCQLRVNGRQIKNVVKISLLLATRHRQPLNIEHIRTVLSATRQGVLEVSATGVPSEGREEGTKILRQA